MDDSFNLARHIARFMSHLMRQPDAVEQQKLELRAIALLTKDGTVRLTTRAGQLVANGIGVPQVLVGVRDVAEQMLGHGVEAIEINRGMSPGELLALFRVIAEPLTHERRALHGRIRALALTTIVVTIPSEIAEEKAVSEETPVDLAPKAGSPERISFLLERAARGGDGQPLVPHFDEVAFAVEQAIREGRTDDAIGVFCQLIEFEAKAVDSEIRRQFLLTVRRLVKPTLLHPIALKLADSDEGHPKALAILTRCSTDGSDAVIDQYGRAITAVERTRFRTALDLLTATDLSLVSMLGDARPHMVRLAATLLGERQPVDGDRALADELTSDDHRVRRAVVRALGRYDTHFAIDAIARALTDPIVEVRLESVAALGKRRSPRVGEILGRAIDEEDEEEVQIGMLGALGRVGTSEAVSMLAKAADAGSGLFGSRKGAAMRVAAVRALGEIRSAGAMSALLALANDKEREVRETAKRAAAR
ncbi:MAG: HEAT repeat domain-containing protein [Gemmatimonadetes bacterium]|nr:HEAT repeat domain-containing protein [Gemmatimonadota bacterium]